MSQPCIQQTAFTVHQLADDEVGQLFLSLRFRCAQPRRQAYVQGEQQNYHVVLFSVFVLAFFLILEWTAPMTAQPSFASTPQKSTSTPLMSSQNDQGLRLANWDQE